MNCAGGLTSDALLRATDAFSVLFETSSDCVACVSLDRRIKQINASGLALLDLGDGAGVIDDDWAKLWPDVLQADVGEVVRRATAGETASFQALRPNALDEPRWWNVTVAPITDPQRGVVALLSIARDVTFSATETELFENAFQNAPIGKALVALDGRFLKVNRAFCTLAGFDETALLGADFQSLARAHDLEADLLQSARMIAGELAGYQTEKRYMRPDGQEIWVKLAVSLVRFPDGRPKHFISQVLDLSARHAAETRYRLLAENISDVVGIHGDDGRCLYISPSAERVFGFKAEEVLGRTTEEFVPEHGRARLQDLQTALAHASRGETVTRQIPMLHKDGRALWVEFAGRIAKDDLGRRITVVVTRDITDRREVERRYRLLAENTADLLVLADLTGTAKFVAGGLGKILGWDADDVLGRSGADIIHPDDYERVHQMFQRVREGATGLQVRFRSRCKDGSWRWLESHPSLLVEEDGERAIVDAVHDVTEQVFQEEALAHARAEAEAAALAKAQFLANMSHEIRTPLTAVIGFSDLLSGRDDLQSDVRRYADRIASASRSLLTIVNDVLDFSKLEAGQFEIHPAPARVLEVVEESLALFTSAADAKGVQLRLETEVGPDMAVLVDAARLRQVLLNLIGNAVKFTDDGSVTVHLACADQRLVVAVQDTGLGIEPEDQRKLFQRFSQVDASITRSHGGTGLGLAICRGLVEAMGGAIALRSTLGEGSRFEFNIAAPQVEPGARSQPAAAAEGHIARLRVLVADDNPANRELVRAILEAMGAEVFEACDGEEAVQVAAGAAYDVILMDLRMPKLDGRGALEQLRRDAGPNQRTPVIAFTADVLETELSGFDGCVAKPIAPMRLAEAIEACLAAPPDETAISARG